MDFNDRKYWQHKKINATNVWINLITKSIYYVLYPSSENESFKYVVNQEIEYGKKPFT